MNNVQEKLKESFGKYGKIAPIDVGIQEYECYKFTCNNKSLYDKNNILYDFPSVDFALICGKNNECALFNFRAATNDVQDEDTYRIINQINKNVEYGKYTLDSNGDLDWEYRFDIESINSNDLRSALLSFYEGMLMFVLLKKGVQAKQEENKLYE